MGLALPLERVDRLKFEEYRDEDFTIHPSIFPSCKW